MKLSLLTFPILFIFSGLTLVKFFFKTDDKPSFYFNDFATPDGPIPAEFWFEGDSAYIKDGRLQVDSDTSGLRRSSIWLNKFLPKNYRIEFDAHVISSSDTANNINCFVAYSHPTGNSMLDSKDERIDADYPYYHRLNGYIFTYLANGNEDTARFRFRNNPGFQLLYEINKYEAKRNKTYHFTIEKVDRKFRFMVDEMLMMDLEMKNQVPLHQGTFGFRTWHTNIWWDNLLIVDLDDY